MIKLTYCLTRKQGMSREDFQDYWFNVHGPLVRKHAPVLRIARYVQMHSGGSEMAAALRASRMNGELDAAPPVYDGVAQLWWHSAEDLAAGQSEEAAQAGRELLEDEAKFIDFARSPLWFGEEKEIVG